MPEDRGDPGEAPSGLRPDCPAKGETKRGSSYRRAYPRPRPARPRCVLEVTRTARRAHRTSETRLESRARGSRAERGRTEPSTLGPALGRRPRGRPRASGLRRERPGRQGAGSVSALPCAVPRWSLPCQEPARVCSAPLGWGLLRCFYERGSRGLQCWVGTLVSFSSISLSEILRS